MVVRRGPDGKAARNGAQVQIGGNDVYVSLCRRHWREEVEDKPPQYPNMKGAPKGPTQLERETDSTDECGACSPEAMTPASPFAGASPKEVEVESPK
jgi:hypothetical protein